MHQQLDGHFGSEKWRETAEEKSRAISRFVFQFAADGDIQRPAKEIEFERIEQTTRSNQYMMVKEGDVLVRRHSCWCLHCMQCAMTGHAALSSDYRIGQCVRGVADPELYEYTNRNCRVKNGTGVGGPDERARVHGHQLAAKLDEGGGQWVLVEAFDEDGDGDEVWLARTVPAPSLHDKCCRRMTKQTTLHGEETRSTAFSNGDYAIMVEWFERVPEDP